MVGYGEMKDKMLHSLVVSLEWRAIAFVITNIFLWATTHSFWVATGLAFVLQVILFVAYTIWFFFRHEIGEHGVWMDKQGKEN